MAYTKKEYVQSRQTTQAQKALEEQQQKKPGAYQSQWQQTLQTLLDQIQDRPGFSYDVGTDPLWDQYKQQYISQGRQAMMDTMGQAAALTGGYANSYAQTAGQQAYGDYLQKLNNRLPELYSMALERYRLEGDELLQQYELAARQEEQEYGIYQDSVDRYFRELEQLQEAYDTERKLDYDKWAWDTEFSYNQYRDQEADRQWKAEQEAKAAENQQAYDRWLQEFNYQKQQDERKYQQWLQEFQEEQWRYEQQWAASQAKSSGSSGGSGGSGRGGTAAATEDADTAAAKKFVDNMLENATGTRFDPERVIRSTAALTEKQKEEARKYLQLVMGAG